MLEKMYGDNPDEAKSEGISINMFEDSIKGSGNSGVLEKPNDKVPDKIP